MNTPTQATGAHASYNPTGGKSESIGSYPTVEDAKSAAFTYGTSKVSDYRNLHWKQFSDTTWGLMNGGLYTYILVSVIASREAAQ